MRFSIPTEPVPKLRPRTVRKGGLRTFTPAKTLAFEQTVRLCAQAAGCRPLEGPVSIYAEFYFTLPSSLHRKRKPVLKRWHTKKPDLDNCLKALLDGLEGCCFVSDAQVASIHAYKSEAAQGERGHIDVTVEPL